MPSLRATSATKLPIFPKPIIPRVRPGNSRPANFFLPDSTFLASCPSTCNSLTKSIAPTKFLLDNSNPDNTNSLTAFAFAPGVLKTGIPAAAIRFILMLLVPAPARPTANKLSLGSKSSKFADRTNIACGSSNLSP